MADSHKKKYALKAVINGKRYSKRTNDIEQTLMELKPEFVLTEMYVTVKQDNAVIERRLLPLDAKKFYRDEIFRMIFINSLGLV